MRAKHIIGDLEGFFEGAKTFFTPQIWKPAKFPKHSYAQMRYEIGYDSVKCSV